MPMTIEHIIPLVAGGTSDEENLWLSCPICNGHKGMQTHYPDPESKQIVPLFNPRQQIWSEHFAWSEEGTQVLGITETGRATVEALALNSELRVRSREIWVKAGYHPPD